MKTIRPFGPAVGKTSIPDKLILKLNNYIDEILSDEKKQNELNYGEKLAGNVKQEFKLDKKFTLESGWGKFLMENTFQWIFQST